MNDLVKRLRIKAGMIEMGEMISWGSDSALMREAADVLEMAAPAVQGEPVGYLRKDQLRQVQRMGPMLGEIADSPRVDRVPVYAAPQPAEQKPECGCCGQMGRCDDDCDAVVIGGHRAAEQKPTTDVSGLVEALEGILAVAERVDSWESFPSDPIEIAETALAAHRKQGGEA